MAAFDADHGKNSLRSGSTAHAATLIRWIPTNSRTCSGTPSDLEAQFDRFPDARGDLVQGLRLRVAPGQLPNGSDLVAVFVTLNDDIELTLQWITPALISARINRYGFPIIAGAHRGYRDSRAGDAA